MTTTTATTKAPRPREEAAHANANANDGDGGQATVELALLLPVVLVTLLLVVQVAVIARDQLLVAHAARIAARAAAVEPADTGHDQRRRASVASAVARSAPGLKRERVSTETSYQGGSPALVIVRVRYAAPTDVPVVGPFLPDVLLGANAAMWDETDRTNDPFVPEQQKSAGTAS